MFIKHVLRNDIRRDPHWQPITERCKLCDINYNYIGRQESLQKDLGVIEKAIFLNHTKKSSTLSNEYRVDDIRAINMLRTLTMSTREQLYKLYRSDFELLGYKRFY